MPGEHARISPSSLDRILSCPASVTFAERQPKKQEESSDFAAEGTAAHEDLENCIMMGLPSEDPYIQEVLDYITKRSTKDGLNVVLSERKVHLDKWLGRSDCWGTADVIMYDTDMTVMEIMDLKYGKGIVVEPEDNAQLQAYALGALEGLVPASHKYPTEIITTIAQPRIDHPEGTIRSRLYDMGELIVIKEKMKQRLALIDAPDPVFGPSLKACKWCKVKAICSQRAGHNLSELGLSFGPINPEKLYPVDVLTAAQRIQILDSSDEIRAWLSDVHDSAVKDMMAHKKVEHYKLVRGRSNRKWSLPADETEAALKGLGFKMKEYQTTKLASPAAIEKVVKARHMKAPKRDAVSKLIEKPDGKLTLAHETDSRPAAILPLPDNAFEDVTQQSDEDTLAALLL